MDKNQGEIMLVEYQWTKERYLEACKANYDLKMRSAKLRLLGYVAVVVALFGAYLSYTRGFHATFIVSSILLVYWYLLRWPFYRLQLSINFNRHASKNSHVSWSIDSEGFTISSEAGEGSSKWSAVSDITESTAGFLVRQYPIFYWLPKDRFASERDIGWFRQEIMEKVSTT